MGSHKWLEVRDLPGGKAELRVIPRGQDCLASAGNSPLSLVTVIGRTRTGKSFLLRQLVDKQDWFEVKGGNIPLTKGADVSPVLPVGGSRQRSKKAYVDAEGLGDAGIRKDVLLLTPLLLVSSVVIFNWPGRPAKDKMLEQLGKLVAAAEKVGPRPEGIAQQRCIFGYLYIVLRNVAHAKGVKELLLNEEEPGPLSSAKEVAERNRKRRVLHESFRDIFIFALPTPTEKGDALDSGNVMEIERSLTKEFTTALVTLKKHLDLHILNAQVGLDGQPLTGTTLPDFIKELVAVVNSEQDRIVPESLFAGMQRQFWESSISKPVIPASTWGDMFIISVRLLIGSFPNNLMFSSRSQPNPFSSLGLQFSSNHLQFENARRQTYRKNKHVPPTKPTQPNPTQPKNSKK